MIPGIAPKTAAAPVAWAPQSRHMFVFGAGFVGRYVSERLLAQGWQVSGTCTSVTKKKELEMLGMNAFVFDATQSSLENVHSLRQATHLLISIPPIPGIGDPLFKLDEDLRRMLSHGNLEWLCYLSSTSVYGDCGGVLVDEDHTVNPKSESAKLRYNAEKGWLNLIDDLNLSAFIFRLGGIYGPGRSALDTLAKSKSLSKREKLRESKQYTARIHVADIYKAVLASMSIRCARKMFNVVDDDPAPRAEVFAFARSLIQRRYPDLITETIDAKSTGLDYQEIIVPAEKRVSNARMKQELDVNLLHPTYRSGLQSILDAWQIQSQLPNRSQ
ncbi:unnamed protein product [Miscanthus lutarioriparius]|uniref:NAD-dependent epimerase/dehydratase domain-containing protein n=1 Tax=Miscanthus lutarioriparius TaxID=422564 RepID=A0A811P249_9POAL|nr:unnamed protein product [Miscanthus lutarioriparius]